MLLSLLVCELARSSFHLLHFNVNNNRMQQSNKHENKKPYVYVIEGRIKMLWNLKQKILHQTKQTVYQIRQTIKLTEMIR